MVGAVADRRRDGGALAELYRTNFDKDYPQLPQEKARIVLVEAGDEIFSMFKPNLREYAKDALETDGRGYDGRSREVGVADAGDALHG